MAFVRPGQTNKKDNKPTASKGFTRPSKTAKIEPIKTEPIKQPSTTEGFSSAQKEVSRNTPYSLVNRDPNAVPEKQESPKKKFSLSSLLYSPLSKDNWTEVKEGLRRNFNPTETERKQNIEEMKKSPSTAFGIGLGNGTTLGLNSKMLELSTQNKQGVKDIEESAKKNNKAAYTVGEIAGSIAPWSAAEGLVKTVGGKALKKIGSELGRRVIIGGGAGALTEGVQSAIEGNNAKKVATDSLVGGAMGGAGEVLGSALGKGINKITNSLLKRNPKTEIGKAIEEAAPITDDTPVKYAAEAMEKDIVNTSVPIRKKVSTAEIKAVDDTFNTVKNERGFSKNIRSDEAMNSDIRKSFDENPLTYDALTNKETLSKAEERAKDGFGKAYSDWNKSIDKFDPSDVPLARKLANEAAQNGDLETARRIIADVSEKLTQAGQYSQAASILRKSDPSAFNMFINRQFDKLNEQGRKIYGNKWDDIKLTDNEMKRIHGSGIMDEVSRESMMEEIYNRVSKSIPSSKMEKFDAWRRIAMLLNPKTHVRNVVGNTIMMGLRKSGDTVGALLEKAARIKPGERTKSFMWSWNKDIVKKVDADWEIFKKDLTGNGRYELDNLNFMGKDKPIFKNKPLEAVNRFSKWALNAGDVPFMKRAYKDALGQFMSANRLTEVTDKAREYATRRAEEATFKQANKISKFLSKVKRDGGIAGKLTEAAIPFSKTPTNILARSIEYSPAGIVKALFSKDRTPQMVIENLSKGLTGSAVVGLGFLLADIGWGRSEKTTSKNAEAILSQAGEQPNSIMTSLGSYTFDWAQPFAVPLAMGMTIHQALEKNDNVDVEGITDAVAAGGDTIFNMSMLQNIKGLLGGGFGSATEKIMGLPVSYIEQAWPTFFGQVARTMDDTKRSTYDPSPVKSFVNEIKAKTPGLSKSLEPKLDVFGNEQSNGGIVQQFLSPGYAKGKTNDPVTLELARLYKDNKETDILPKVAPYKFTVKGKEIKLLPKQVTEFQRVMGKENYIDIKKYLSENSKASDKDKLKKIAKIVKNNYDDTKEKFIPKE